MKIDRANHSNAKHGRKPSHPEKPKGPAGKSRQAPAQPPKRSLKRPLVIGAAILGITGGIASVVRKDETIKPAPTPVQTSSATVQRLDSQSAALPTYTLPKLQDPAKTTQDIILSISKNWGKSKYLPEISPQELRAQKKPSPATQLLLQFPTFPKNLATVRIHQAPNAREVVVDIPIAHEINKAIVPNDDYSYQISQYLKPMIQESEKEITQIIKKIIDKIPLLDTAYVDGATSEAASQTDLTLSMIRQVKQQFQKIIPTLQKKDPTLKDYIKIRNWAQAFLNDSPQITGLKTRLEEIIARDPRQEKPSDEIQLRKWTQAVLGITERFQSKAKTNYQQFGLVSALLEGRLRLAGAETPSLLAEGSVEQRNALVIEAIARQQHRPITLVIYGGDHRFDKAIADWNYSRPNQAMDLIEAIPYVIDHGAIPKTTQQSEK